MIVQAPVKLLPTPNINRLENAEKCRSEFVCEIKGLVIERSQENKNPDMATGEIEVKQAALPF